MCSHKYMVKFGSPRNNYLYDLPSDVVTLIFEMNLVCFIKRMGAVHEMIKQIKHSYQPVIDFARTNYTNVFAGHVLSFETLNPDDGPPTGQTVFCGFITYYNTIAALENQSSSVSRDYNILNIRHADPTSMWQFNRTEVKQVDSGVPKISRWCGNCTSYRTTFIEMCRANGVIIRKKSKTSRTKFIRVLRDL